MKKLAEQLWRTKEIMHATNHKISKEMKWYDRRLTVTPTLLVCFYSLCYSQVLVTEFLCVAFLTRYQAGKPAITEKPPAYSEQVYLSGVCQCNDNQLLSSPVLTLFNIYHLLISTIEMPLQKKQQQNARRKRGI